MMIDCRVAGGDSRMCLVASVVISGSVICLFVCCHYNDVIMSAIASQMTGVSIVCSTFGSGADKKKHQSSASLAFVWGIHRWPVNSPHKRLVTRKMFDDVVMAIYVVKLQPQSRHRDYSNKANCDLVDGAAIGEKVDIMTTLGFSVVTLSQHTLLTHTKHAINVHIACWILSWLKILLTFSKWPERMVLLTHFIEILYFITLLVERCHYLMAYHDMDDIALLIQYSPCSV